MKTGRLFKLYTTENGCMKILNYEPVLYGMSNSARNI